MTRAVLRLAVWLIIAAAVLTGARNACASTVENPMTQDLNGGGYAISNVTDVITQGPRVDVRAYASFSAAVDAIGTSRKTLLIPNSQDVTANKTVPSNVTLEFLQGGSLAVSTGVTVTLNGKVDAGLYQVFSGAGTVSLAIDSVKEVFPQWWGAVPDDTYAGTTNNAAFAAATDAAYGCGVPVRITSGTWTFSSLWHINKPISVIASGSGSVTLTGGDSDGVIWYGYRTLPNQNLYFENKKIEGFTVIGTNATGYSFTSSKSLNVTFKDITAKDGNAGGIYFGAAVNCIFEELGANNNAGNGIVFSYFTNSDGTTNVPCTSNVVIKPYIRYQNGSYGLHLADCTRATIIGGNIESNDYTGAQIDGNENTFIGVWFERNALSDVSVPHLRISGDQTTVLQCHFTAVQTPKKIIIDDDVSYPVVKGCSFNPAPNSAHRDIMVGSNVTKWEFADNKHSTDSYDGSWSLIYPSRYFSDKEVSDQLPINENGDMVVYHGRGTIAAPSGASTYFTLPVTPLSINGKKMGMLSVVIFDDASTPVLNGSITCVPLVVNTSAHQYWQVVNSDALKWTAGNSLNKDIVVLELRTNGLLRLRSNTGSPEPPLRHVIYTLTVYNPDGSLL